MAVDIGKSPHDLGEKKSGRKLSWCRSISHDAKVDGCLCGSASFKGAAGNISEHNLYFPDTRGCRDVRRMDKASLGRPRPL